MIDQQEGASILKVTFAHLVLALTAVATPAVGSESVFFDFPEDGSTVVLELIEPMGFGAVHPETGERGNVLHHLIVHADGNMWLSKFTSEDPFGYKTTRLSMSEMNELFAQVYEKSALSFDPRTARARELEEPFGGTSLEPGFFRINVVVYDPAKSETKRAVRFETPTKVLRRKAKFYKDDEFMKLAEGIQVLRERFFDAPKGVWH